VFFLPVKVLSRLFRRLFLEALEKAFEAGELGFFGALEPLRERDAFRRHLAPVWKADWVVYAKPPFAGPDQVLDYVGRYTHRVALSNCSTSRTARCASAGRTTVMAAARRR
jgi:putative transposase